MSIAELSGTEAGPGPGYDRTPPQDVAAEQSVLGGMLLSKDAIADVVEVLRGHDFYRPAHETIFEAVLDLYGRGEPADPVTVTAELQKRGELGRVGGAPYVHTLVASVPTAANAGFYAEIVRERAVLRRLVEAGTRIVQMGYGGDGDADQIVDRAQAEVFAVTDRRTSEDYLPLSDVMEGALDEIEAIGSRGGQMVGVPTGFADLDQLTNGLHSGQMVVLAARPAVGKALALNTPLPTPTGWTTMGEVQVGDQLIGDDGRPTLVTAATQVMYGRPCYEVHFSDGTTVVADAEHGWLTETRAARRSAHAARTGAGGTRTQRTHPSVRTTAEIARTLRVETVQDHRLNHTVRNPQAMDLPEADLPLPPYALGVWLGAGHTAGARYTSADPEIAMHIESDGLVVRRGTGMTFSLHLDVTSDVPSRDCIVCGREFTPRTVDVRTCGRSCGGRSRGLEPPRRPQCPDCGSEYSGRRRCAACHAHHGTVPALLRGLGVLGNKHIPPRYLRASEDQRRALLAGLLDTDGTVTGSGSVQFAVTNRRLAADARELIATLGYKTGLSTKRVRGRSEPSSTAYTITFSSNDDVFRLTRKRLVHKERRSGRNAKIGFRYIVDVSPVASVPVRCVEVDNASHLYLAGPTMVPTHNSTLGLDIARSAAIKHQMTTVIFSLEMGRNEITMRLLSAEARVPLHHMRSGGMSDDDWNRIARRTGEVSSAPLFIDDSPNMTMMEIRAKCRRLKQRHDLRLVIIDYLQLMTSGKRVESRQQEVAEFSRALKLLAKELEVPVVAISQLNRGAEQRQDKKPMLSDLRESGCLTAETRLMRADTGAEVTLGELHASGARDVPVWALDESLRYVPRTLTHVFPTGRRVAYEMRLASGKRVTATANHRFLTYDGWRALGDLSVGARVGVPRHVPAPLAVCPWPEDRVVLLAHLIGAGSCVRRQPLRYASVDEENLTTVEAAAASAFGIAAVRDRHPAARCTSLRLPAPYRLAHGRRNPLEAWLAELGLFGLRSHEKRVPGQVFSLPKAQVSLFLRHLWATDGSVTVTRTGRGGRIDYTSTSRRLAVDVSRLLLRFGIGTRLREHSPLDGRPQYSVDVSGRDDQLRFLREIGCAGQRASHAGRLLAILEAGSSDTDVDTVPSEVWSRVGQVLVERGSTHRPVAAAMGTPSNGSTLWRHAPSRARLGRIAAVLEDEQLEIEATNDVFWDTVVAVEQVGEREVFDGTVMRLHNFVVDGVAAHNSIEQDADMVILLHREDAYEKESPRAGEADFIVAKHRNGPTATITVAFQGHYSRFVDMAQ